MKTTIDAKDAKEKLKAMTSTISPEVLGRRIRQLRTQRSQTQQNLAGDDYSKSYISAIEQGKTRPSLQALQRIAARLNVSVGMLLDPTAAGFATVDSEATLKRVRRARGARGGRVSGMPATEHGVLDVIGAEIFLHMGRVEEAFNILRARIPEDALLQDVLASTASLDPGPFQQACYLAATALVRLGNPQEAQLYAQKGLEVGRQLGSGENVERLRNLLGEAYYLAEQPLSALEHHRVCVEAVRNNIVRDPNLKLRIYRNIANDYSALQESDKALDAYGVAMELLSVVNTPADHAKALWEVALDYAQQGDFDTAKAAAGRALAVLDMLDNMQLIVEMQNRYGEMLLGSGDLVGAEAYLHNALALAERVGSDTDKAIARTHFARLYLQQGNIEAAEKQVASTLGVFRDQQDKDRDTKAPQGGEDPEAEVVRAAPTSAASGRALANLLALAGEIAARRKDNRKANELFAEAVTLMESWGTSEERGDTYQRYAQILMDWGEHKRAAEYFDRAFRAFRRNTAVSLEP